MKPYATFLALTLIISCTSRSEPDRGNDPGPPALPALSDTGATYMARVLYANLHEAAKEHVLLAHQDALAYGIGWTGSPDGFKTDIHEVCRHHPAVFGWDLGHIGDSVNIDNVPFAHMRQWAIAVHEKGGINTYSWHMRNYATGGSSWDTASCVEHMLPGGRAHGLYLEKLDLAAGFFSGLRTPEGDTIPLIFRPFHEMNGGWFWWGSASCTPDQYKELFRFTVDYLRNRRGLHQLIVAYSTDVFGGAGEYLTFYPGDAYVDVMGFDDYRWLSRKETAHRTVGMLETLDSLASSRGKLMAITETGVETIPDADWFTGVVLPTLNANASTRKTAWILLWRNGRPDHFYAPHPGHSGTEDFNAFVSDSLIWTLPDLPSMYH